MLITIGAMIGAGKTSLATLVADHFNSDVFFESVDDNPILPLFYTSTEEEIQANRYPFLLQLWFLNTRFKSIKAVSYTHLQVSDIKELNVKLNEICGVIGTSLFTKEVTKVLIVDQLMSKEC